MTTPLDRRALLSSPLRRRTAGGTGGALVVVFLRGGLDHLSAVFPTDDPDLRAARPTIAVPVEVALDLGDGFGLHPALPRLHELHRAGRLATVVAVGNPAGDRSHFVAQDLVTAGATDLRGDSRGWLARHLVATADDGDSSLRAVTLGTNVDRSLAGFSAIGLPSIATFGLGGTGTSADELEAILRATHHDDDRLVDAVATQALDAAARVAELPAAADGNAFTDIATLLAGDLGIEVVTVDLGGWDTHDRMGTHEQGEMRTLLSGLDDALGGFRDDLDERGVREVTTVVVTEFGRRVAENGSGGTDHGWGHVMWVVGDGVVPGIHGDWVGLGDDVLGERGDVPVTTDFRDVLGEVASSVLAAEPTVAFPDHEHRAPGVMV